MEREIALPGGCLTVRVTEAHVPLDRLCGFAARANPKRGFLVVSRVLGRHLPARPSEMTFCAAALAVRLPALPGPVLVMALAETAVCLGQSVYAAMARDDALFLHSTRQQLGRSPDARFEEPHSHAAAHLVYLPDDPAHAALLAAARSLVIVDDEASTGTTFGNLARAMAPLLPRLERIVTAVLTDWSDGEYLATLPVAAERFALLSGQLVWRAGRGVSGETAPPAALGSLPAHRNTGRTGFHGDLPGLDTLAASLARGAPERLLVLGTGEFTYPPFRLAAALETRGHDVHVQATTRSPVHSGGVIGDVLSFADNYGTGVPNYLYNARFEPGRRVLICHETPRGSVDPALVSALDAELVPMGPDA